MFMEIVLVGCSSIYCIPLATFVIVPPESESINWGGLHTEYHKPYMRKLNQAFAITIKRAVYHINFSGHKTFKSVSLFYLATSFTSALPQQNVLFSPISGCTLARTRWFLKLQPERNETNEACVKTLLTFSSAYKNIICFLIMAFRL